MLKTGLDMLITELEYSGSLSRSHLPVCLTYQNIIVVYAIIKNLITLDDNMIRLTEKGLKYANKI